MLLRRYHDNVNEVEKQVETPAISVSEDVKTPKKVGAKNGGNRRSKKPTSTVGVQ